jgi:hypothetical protein
MGFGRIAWLVSCGSDEYDVVIKLSLFGWVTSGGTGGFVGSRAAGTGLEVQLRPAVVRVA